MIRSLTLKLILAFLIVSLTGAVLSAVYLQQRTRSEFTRFLSDQFQSSMIDSLIQYYRTNGSWSGVEGLMQELDGSMRRPDFNRGLENEPPLPEIRHIPLTLVNQNRLVIYEDFQTRESRATRLRKRLPRGHS